MIPFFCCSLISKNGIKLSSFFFFFSKNSIFLKPISNYLKLPKAEGMDKNCIPAEFINSVSHVNRAKNLIEIRFYISGVRFQAFTIGNKIWKME